MLRVDELQFGELTPDESDAPSDSVSFPCFVFEFAMQLRETDPSVGQAQLRLVGSRYPLDFRTVRFHCGRLIPYTSNDRSNDRGVKWRLLRNVTMSI